jgi:hypothetical protein
MNPLCVTMMSLFLSLSLPLSIPVEDLPARFVTANFRLVDM